VEFNGDFIAWNSRAMPEAAISRFLTSGLGFDPE